MTDRPTDHPLPRCERALEVPAFLQEEMSPEEKADFQTHLLSCPACREETRRVSELIAKLRSVPEETPPPDLAERIMSAVFEAPPAPLPAKRAFFTRRMFAASAAAAAVLAAAAYLLLGPYPAAHPGGGAPAAVTASLPPETGGGAPAAPARADREVLKALEWLASTQDEDGGWSPERWEGKAEFKVGLSALSLLAFVRAGRFGVEDKLGAAARKAVRFLLRSENGQGLFGPEFGGTAFNQALALLALVETYSGTRDPALEAPITRAVSYVLRKYSAEGTQRLLDPATPWLLEALELAGDLGWTSAGRAAAQGIEMLASAGEPASQDPATLSAGAMLLLLSGSGGTGRDLAAASEALSALSSALRDRTADLTRTYFIAHALETARRLPGISPSDLPSPSLLAGRLRKTQVTSGSLSGSWNPDDKWSAAGGRIYSTAMAALTLEASLRVPPAPGVPPR